MIARGSSLQYRQTTKRPAEIARELGADYLLTGTVRWEKSGGASRVRVTPELVDARPGQRRRARAGGSSSTRRSPTSSRCRPTSPPRWRTRSAWRWPTAPGASSRPSRPRTWRPTTSSSRARRLEAMGVTGSRVPAPGDRVLRAGGRARLHLRHRVGPARPTPERTLYGNSVPDPALGEQAPPRGGAGPPAQAERAPRSFEPSVPYYATVDPRLPARRSRSTSRVSGCAPDNVSLLGRLAVTRDGSRPLGQRGSAAGARRVAGPPLGDRRQSTGRRPRCASAVPRRRLRRRPLGRARAEQSRHVVGRRCWSTLGQGRSRQCPLSDPGGRATE